jgi:DinB family protein
MLSQGLLRRLEIQLDAIPTILAGAAPDAIEARSPSGHWSARENLAHLARHHSVFLERIHRILDEDNPDLGRYRAEDDPAWPRWSKLPLDEILSRIRVLRAEIVALLEGLSNDRINRTGIHSLLGEMSISRWVEFFLLHEAHHLYVAMLRLGGASATARGR